MPKHSSSYDNPFDDWGDPGHSAGQNYGDVPPSYRLPGTRGGNSPIYRAPAAPAGGSKSKILAFLLALFLGPFGAHNFYLGQTGAGVGKMVLAVLGLGAEITLFAVVLTIWIIIDLVRIVIGHESMATDAKGTPLL